MLSQSDVELFIRQGPERARVATGKEKDRKPVDPPPIVQLRVKDNLDPSQNYLQSPYLIMVVSLYEAHSDHSPSGSPDQLISGTLVSSLHRLKDVDNSDGAFFVFGDLSVKVEGQYRLCFTLHEISNGACYSVKDIISEPFTVYAHKNFPGMAESTFLSRSFGDQGVRLRIRKEARNSMAKRPQQPPPMSMQQPDQYAHYYQQQQQQQQQQMPGHMIHQPGGPYGAPHPHSHPPPQQQYAGFVDDRTKRQRFDYPPDPRDPQYPRYPDQRPPYQGYPPISQPPAPGYPQYSAPPPSETQYAYSGHHSSPASSPYESPGQPHARVSIPPLRHDMPPPPPPIHIGQAENRYAPQLPPVSSLSGPSIPASLPPATTLPPPIPSFGRTMAPSSYSSYPALTSPSYPGSSQPGGGINLPPLQVHNHSSLGPSSPLGPHSVSNAPGPPTSFDSAVQRVSPPREYGQR